MLFLWGSPLVGNRKGTGTGELEPDLEGLGPGQGEGRPKTYPHPFSEVWIRSELTLQGPLANLIVGVQAASSLRETHPPE